MNVSTESHAMAKRKTRTPKSAESITAGALKLDLKERVELCKALQDSIGKEAELLTEKAKDAQNLRHSLNGKPE